MLEVARVAFAEVVEDDDVVFEVSVWFCCCFSLAVNNGKKNINYNSYREFDGEILLRIFSRENQFHKNF